MDTPVSEVQAEAGRTLRLCLGLAEHVAPNDSVAAGVLVQSIRRIRAKGNLADPRLLRLTGTTLTQVEAVLSRLEAIAEKDQTF